LIDIYFNIYKLILKVLALLSLDEHKITRINNIINAFIMIIYILNCKFDILYYSKFYLPIFNEN